jgi:hypothetical protein
MAESTDPVLGVPPRSQVDLERRVAADHNQKKLTEDLLKATASGPRDFATEDTDTTNYVGVSPEYMTHANSTEAPLRGEDSIETKVEDELFSQTPPVNKTEVEREGQQIIGTGSGDPLVYPTTSGDVWTQDVNEGKVKQEDVPTKVEQLPEGSKPVTTENPKAPAKAPKPPTSPAPQGQ